MLHHPSDPIRVGLVGGGFMGRKHAQFITANPEARLVAVADPFSDRLAREHGVRHVADDQDLLRTGDVDAVIIANPNALHVETALRCIDAGVATLVEKPVASDYAEARRLLAAVEAADVPVLVGHHRRHHPAIPVAKEMIASKTLGDVVGVNGIWANKKDDGYFEDEWHRSKGAGVMLINLVHDLDLLRYLCGEVRTVQASTSSAVRGYEVEETVSVILTFANGALGSFLASDAAASPWGWDQATEDSDDFPFNPTSSCYAITGTLGSLSVPQLAHHHYASGEGDWHDPLSMRFAAKATGDSYTNQMRHFVDVVRRRALPVVSVRDAVRTLALIEATRRAAETGGPVDVDLFSGELVGPAR